LKIASCAVIPTGVIVECSRCVIVATQIRKILIEGKTFMAMKKAAPKKTEPKPPTPKDKAKTDKTKTDKNQIGRSPTKPPKNEETSQMRAMRLQLELRRREAAKADKVKKKFLSNKNKGL
jgi:hypothetical protein